MINVQHDEQHPNKKVQPKSARDEKETLTVAVSVEAVFFAEQWLAVGVVAGFMVAVGVPASAVPCDTTTQLPKLPPEMNC